MEMRPSQSNLPQIGIGHSLGVNQAVPATNEPNEYFISPNSLDFRDLISTYEDGNSATAFDTLSGNDWTDLNRVANQNFSLFTPYVSQLEGYSPIFGNLTMV